MSTFSPFFSVPKPGYLLMSVWSWVILCAPDFFSWNFAFLLLNGVQTMSLMYSIRPVRFCQELEEVYTCIFLPLRVPRYVAVFHSSLLFSCVLFTYSECPGMRHFYLLFSCVRLRHSECPDMHHFYLLFSCVRLRDSECPGMHHFYLLFSCVRLRHSECPGMHHSQLLFSCVHFQSLKVPRYAAVPPFLRSVHLCAFQLLKVLRYVPLLLCVLLCAFSPLIMPRYVPLLASVLLCEFQPLKMPRYAAVPPSLACVQLCVHFNSPGSVLRYVALFVLVTAEYDSMVIGVILPLPPRGCANDQ